MDNNRYLVYRFVYDTIDKSVELVNIAELKKSGVVISDAYNCDKRLFTSDSSMWFKLRTLYPDDIIFSGSFSKILCSYKINDYTFLLSLEIEKVFGNVFLGVCCDRFEFEKSTIAVSIDWTESLFCVTSKSVSICIPDLMFNYVLTLYNRHDFNGIMRSIYNFLGTNINMLISNFGNGDLRVGLLEWN